MAEIERLTEPPADGKPPVYASIHHGAGGWNSSVWRWNDEEPDCIGFYEPMQTGVTNTSLGTGLREDAVLEAESWAESDQIPLWIPPPPKEVDG